MFASENCFLHNLQYAFFESVDFVTQTENCKSVSNVSEKYVCFFDILILFTSKNKNDN